MSTTPKVEVFMHPRGYKCLIEAQNYMDEKGGPGRLAWICPMGTWIRATAAQRAEAFLITLKLLKP